MSLDHEKLDIPVINGLNANLGGHYKGSLCKQAPDMNIAVNEYISRKPDYNRRPYSTRNPHTITVVEQFVNEFGVFG